MIGSHIESEQPEVLVAASTRAVVGADGVFPVVDAGAGPAVLLLHGFPDSRFLWRFQIRALAQRFRVIAPDLIGFGDAPRPQGLEAYARTRVVAGLASLLDALDVERVHVVGHDWGAAVGWRLASWRPERVASLTTFCVGAPPSRGWDDREQRDASGYFELFAANDAETLLSSDQWRLFRAWTRGHGDMTRYLRDLARPGALTAALNWYRAARDTALTSAEPPFAPVSAPVFAAWAEQDPYLLEPQILGSREFVCSSFRYVRIPNAGHWPMLEKADACNEMIRGFLEEFCASGP